MWLWTLLSQKQPQQETIVIMLQIDWGLVAASLKFSVFSTTVASNIIRSNEFFLSPAFRNNVHTTMVNIFFFYSRFRGYTAPWVLYILLHSILGRQLKWCHLLAKTWPVNGRRVGGLNPTPAPSSFRVSLGKTLKAKLLPMGSTLPLHGSSLSLVCPRVNERPL